MVISKCRSGGGLKPISRRLTAAQRGMLYALVDKHQHSFETRGEEATALNHAKDALKAEYGGSDAKVMKFHRLVNAVIRALDKPAREI